MTVKTDMSRFDIHDELTAPDDSAKLLKGMASAGGSVSKFVGVLAGSPAALRAFARMRHELRGGELPRPTRERIALAVAEDRGDTYSIAQHARTARAAGLGLDEISRARGWSSSDPREAALLTFLKALFEADGRPAHHLLEEAREVDWSDEQLLEAVAHLALSEFQSLMANAAALPQDQTDPSILPSAAAAA
ncbi:MAG: carboxymuconolactone decarboxylase family protein [Actinobacteria bacterium]|nr:carboxymuconolactone decarboxylase family protein [Actinomycetota bacterium]